MFHGCWACSILDENYRLICQSLVLECLDETLEVDFLSDGRPVGAFWQVTVHFHEQAFACVRKQRLEGLAHGQLL